MDKLYYQESPIVTIATNRFINVPTIMQYEDIPLISVIREMNLGYTTEIPIYYSDGTYMAKVKGTRVYPTDDGKKIGIKIRKLADQTICEMNGKPVFEVYHQKGDAFLIQAELFTPDASFVKVNETHVPQLIDTTGNKLVVGGFTFQDCEFRNLRIGISLYKNGGGSIG
jgi:hypothetical protein